MKNNKGKYKIALLSDLKESTSTSLESAVALAKMIDGEIELFHVKKPTDIVEAENQLSAMRSINHQHIAVDKRIQKLIKPISQKHKINIGYSFAFGHVKSEISDYLKESLPDIVVLGKKKPKTFSLVGDRISEFVLKIYDGAVLIANEKKSIMPDNGISLGFLNSSRPNSNLEFADVLMNHSQKPLKSFKIVKKTTATNEPSGAMDETTIEYLFEHNDSSLKSLSSYLSKNNIDLLSIDREPIEPETEHLFTPDVNSMINKLDVTILVAGK